MPTTMLTLFWGAVQKKEGGKARKLGVEKGLDLVFLSLIS